ncbi:MAG TPA: hypothetical protein PKL15_21010, partial [Saprospiraceae bacterium]|nr:hypothetical protein [Saprospiraceae bacterium]
MYTSHSFGLLKLWQVLTLLGLFGASSGVLANHAAATALSSDTCSNPVVINNVTVQHTLCGLSTGSISVNIAGGNAGCSFQWMPSVSTSATATQLPAGAYQLTITRQNNP